MALAGVKLRPYVEVQQKFHEKLSEYSPKYTVKDTKEVAYVPKKDSGGSQPGGGEGGGTQQGGGQQGGSQGGDNGGGLEP